MTSTVTQQEIDYALMAGAVYVSNRNVINQLPTPVDWSPFFYQSLPSGFEAVSFQNETKGVSIN